MTRTILFALCSAALVGCSSPTSEISNEEVGQKLVINEVGGLLRSASAEANRGPARVADLARYESTYPRGFDAVKSGAVVVIWGTSVPSEGDVAAGKGGTDIIAYEKQVPAEGGWVVLQNGNVKQMTAEEFKSAPKAK